MPVALVGMASGAIAQDKATASAAIDTEIATVSPAPTAATEPRPPLIPAQNFAARNQYRGSQLSPDGSTIALEATLNGVSRIGLINADTRQPIGAFAMSDKQQFEWLRWAGNDKLLVSLSTAGEFLDEEVRFTRLVLIHTKENWVKLLGRRNGVVEGDNVIHIASDGSHALVSVQGSVYDYPSVYRYDLDQGGAMKSVQDPQFGVWRWYADNAGVVRMGTGWRDRALRVYYRPAAGQPLKMIGKLKEDDEETKYWSVAEIISGSDQGYVLRQNDKGRVGLHLFNYATGQIVETIYENPDWDVSDFWLRDGKPIAVFYTDERERVVWFDDTLAKLHGSISKALKEEVVWIASRAKDDSRMLVWAGGPADPGAIYVYTPGARRIDQLSELRPQVDFRQLARPAAVNFKARDGVAIQAYLTLPRGREAKNLPLIVMPHGGPFWVRDTLDYDDMVQLLANRGYAVLQPNFRGSGGYGEAFHKLGAGQIGRKMQDDLDDAMDWAVTQGIADKARACLVGGSYGGYAAIWGVIRNPERWRCAASWAGVTDWDRILKYDRKFLTRKGREDWEELVAGDGTATLDQVSPYRLAAQLSRPLLLAHGTEDTTVPFNQFKAMRDAAAKGAPVAPQLLVIEDEGHSFSKPENERAWYEALETFLAKHNPAD